MAVAMWRIVSSVLPGVPLLLAWFLWIIGQLMQLGRITMFLLAPSRPWAMFPFIRAIQGTT